MGSIKRSFANNLSTGGVFTSSAIANSSVTGITTLANAPEDGITFISSQTASASASINFTTGIDSTYKAYKFVFVNLHPADDGIEFEFNVSTDGGSTFLNNKTTTFFAAQHSEDDATTALSYNTNTDRAQSTAFQPLTSSTKNDNDTSLSGSLLIFNPSSTTYVKHFIGVFDSVHSSDRANNAYIAGYVNITTAINAVRFRASSGNTDAGTIYMYGIK